MSTPGDGTDTAASRLHQLATYLLEHPVTGPSARTATSTTPKAPMNLGMLDYIDRSVAEVVQHTRTVNPDAGPLPAQVADVYDWCRQHTEHAPDIDQQRIRALEIRHRLEHAVRAGDALVVRLIRCPLAAGGCGTLGLHWQPRLWRAACVNIRCARANHGTHREWKLAELAYEQAAIEKSLRDCAT
jgi:hypothetical protein